MHCNATVANTISFICEQKFLKKEVCVVSYTGCPKKNEQFEMAGIQSVFKIFSKTQISDHHKIWPFYKLLSFLKSVKK